MNSFDDAFFGTLAAVTATPRYHGAAIEKLAAAAPNEGPSMMKKILPLLAASGAGAAATKVYKDRQHKKNLLDLLYMVGASGMRNERKSRRNALASGAAGLAGGTYLGATKGEAIKGGLKSMLEKLKESMGS